MSRQSPSFPSLGRRVVVPATVAALLVAGAVKGRVTGMRRVG